MKAILTTIAMAALITIAGCETENPHAESIENCTNSILTRMGEALGNDNNPRLTLDGVTPEPTQAIDALFRLDFILSTETDGKRYTLPNPMTFYCASHQGRWAWERDRNGAITSALTP